MRHCTNEYTFERMHSFASTLRPPKLARVLASAHHIWLGGAKVSVYRMPAALWQRPARTNMPPKGLPHVCTTSSEGKF
eukprot:391893-Pelagomonas_calceolata.AAC.3